jgi:hypothetical protein
MAPRWVGAKIRKSFVCGDEKPPLLLKGLPEERILPTTHALLRYSANIFVSSFPEERSHSTRQIFIDLEAHVPAFLHAVSGRRLSWCRTSAA